LAVVRVTEWQGDQNELRAAAETYGVTFAQPPYEEDAADGAESFIERTKRYRERNPDFRLLLAKDRADECVGLVLGTGASAGNWWYDRVAEIFTQEQRDQWMPGPVYSIGELAVAPSARGQGIAAALMSRVVEGLPYQTALLGCDARAVPAQRLYLSLNWHLITDQARFGAGEPKWLMGLSLSG
jgi:ribosomal protein S18 acetylase RimI-like enzyme